MKISTLTSQAVLSPPGTDSLPTFLLVQSTPVLHPQSSFYPVLAAHLAQPTECTGECKSFFVAGEEVAVLEHCHVHPKIVHHLAHHVVNPVVLFRMLNRPLETPTIESFANLLGRHEELK